MPDFTMCTNKECPGRFDCKRYVSKPGERQSYMTFDCGDNTRCESFIPTVEFDKKQPSKSEVFILNVQRVKNERFRA